MLENAIQMKYRFNTNLRILIQKVKNRKQRKRRRRRKKKKVRKLYRQKKQGRTHLFT